MFLIAVLLSFSMMTCCMQDTTVETQSELENYIQNRDHKKFDQFYKKIVDLRSEHHQKLALDSLNLTKLKLLIEPQAQSDKEIIYKGRKLMIGGNYLFQEYALW